jgi:hypothetical protein
MAGRPIAASAGWLATRLAVRRQAEAGLVVAAGYHALAQNRPATAAAWLDDQTSVLQAAGPMAMTTAFNALLRFGHGQHMPSWFVRALDGAALETLPAPTAHALAYSYLALGQPGAALLYANVAVAALDSDPVGDSMADGVGRHITLGETLLALGRAEEATATLHTAVTRFDCALVRLLLARALAAQARPDQAMIEADQVLRRHVGPWPEGFTHRDTTRWLLAAGQEPAGEAKEVA